ncbi:MAG: hypothetical protein J6K15_10955 [Lachnospiraceae bacterium]|nr:hypothetical protein [Lachnospiraceae bacterium]MBP3578622.1 hypothetical protein [Lachnospiraceae bacterium]
MSDKLEQAMKKIHIYLANCKESAYSSEDLIVSKKRIFSLLEELNYAVYDAMEEYEVTVAARDRGIAQAERLAADIKDDALLRADEIHASSLLYTQEAVSDLKRTLEYMQKSIRSEYERMLANCEERLEYLEQDSMEIFSQLETKADAKIYLHMIEDIKAKRKTLPEEVAAELPYSRSVGSAAGSDSYEAPADEFESKLSSAIVVEVHDTPKIPEGFGKGKKKKKGKGAAGGESAVTAQELDAEYFAFQEEQQKALEAQLAEEMGEEAGGDADEEGESIFGAWKKFGFGNKKK